jgi:hypothetical protein
MAAQETRGGVIEHRIGTNGLFAIATSSGGIDLRGGDGEAVRISTVDPDDAPLLDRFEVETSEGVLRVRSPRGVFLGLDVFGRRFGWGGGVGELDLVVEMPRSARLELATVSGDVHVAGLRGQQRYKSVSGDLELEDAAGQVEVESTSGDVSLQAAAPVALRLRTVSGDVSAKAPHIRRLDATTMSGDIRVEGALEAGQEHSVETVSGDTRLVTASGLTIEARTVSGGISSDTPHRTGGAPGRRAIILGDGKAHLGFRSLSGDLQILGRGADTATPEGAAWRGAIEPPEPPSAPAPPTGPGTPDPLEAARLEILRALGAGEIDVAEGSDRLARLDDEVLP